MKKAVSQTQRQSLTGVIKGHFLLNDAAALLHLPAQLRLAASQLLLAADRHQKDDLKTVYISRAIQ